MFQLKRKGRKIKMQTNCKEEPGKESRVSHYLMHQISKNHYSHAYDILKTAWQSQNQRKGDLQTRATGEKLYGVRFEDFRPQNSIVIPRTVT